MTELLQGATMMGCLTVALFFLRFWRETGDRFFLIFALAFATFGVNRLLLVALDDDEAQTAVYAARLVAFLLIAAAIVDKNRARQA
jgi:4-hydroxybenzoate polyprenyltransferase